MGNEPTFKLSLEAKLLVEKESDKTKQFLIEAASIGTQQNDYTIKRIADLQLQIEEVKDWSRQHELLDKNRFSDLGDKIEPFVWMRLKYLKGKKTLLTLGAALVTLVLIPVFTSPDWPWWVRILFDIKK